MAVDAGPAPLIAPPTRGGWMPGSRAGRAAGIALIVVAVLWTYWPTTRNGFLQVGFDDAIIVDSPVLRDLSVSGVAAMATTFVHAHYVPLTLLSLAVDYHFWELDPRGYHLTNVALHALTAVLVYIALWPIMPSLAAATIAALLFALHPLQMEAVTLAIQRKTVLSGAGFFAALIAYQAWRRDGRRWQYGAALAAFVVAALAKPSVMPLPVLLCLYDYVFVDGRLHWRDKLPFVAVAIAVGAAAAAAHAEVGATRGWHGDDPIVHVVMMGRVLAEYLSAVFAPVGLSPIYYYPKAAALQPLNVAAAVVLATSAVLLVAWRRRAPWTFFAAAWFVLAWAPESNLVPLAQLRADRFLYLPLFGAVAWIAVAIEHVPAWLAPGRAVAGRRWAHAVSALVLAGLALQTRASAAVWQSDVTAWSQTVARHPWCGTAFMLLGHAHRDAGDVATAAAAYRRALALSPALTDAELALARLAPTADGPAARP